MAARASTITNFGRRPARPLQLSSPLVTTVLLLFCCCSSVQSASVGDKKCATGNKITGEGADIAPYVDKPGDFYGFHFDNAPLKDSPGVPFKAITGKDIEFNIVVKDDPACMEAALNQIGYKCTDKKDPKNWQKCDGKECQGQRYQMKCGPYNKKEPIDGDKKGRYITDGNIWKGKGYDGSALKSKNCGLRMQYTSKDFCVLVSEGDPVPGLSQGGFFCCLKDNGVFIAVMVLPTVFLLLLIVLIIWMVVYQRSQLKAIEAWIEECIGGGMTGMSKLGGTTKSKLLTMKGGATTKKSMMTQKGGSKSKFGTTTKGGGAKSKLGQTTVGGASKAASTKRRSVSVPNTQSRGSRENLRK